MFRQIVYSSVKEVDGLTLQVDSFASPEPWTLRAGSREDRDRWLGALQANRATLYMNGTLMKRAKVTKRWKSRYVLLVGPDLHWSKGESKPWRGSVSLVAMELSACRVESDEWKSRAVEYSYSTVECRRIQQSAVDSRRDWSRDIEGNSRSVDS